PTGLGGSSFVFVEDNIFNGTGLAYGVIDVHGGGARFVYRYNQSTGAYLYTHWTSHSGLLPKVFEIYGNTFTADSSYGTTGEYVARTEGGTGVIYNNWSSGYTNPY